MRLILTLGIAAIAVAIVLFNEAAGEVIDQAFDNFTDDPRPGSLLTSVFPPHNQGVSR